MLLDRARQVVGHIVVIWLYDNVIVLFFDKTTMRDLLSQWILRHVDKTTMHDLLSQWMLGHVGKITIQDLLSQWMLGHSLSRLDGSLRPTLLCFGFVVNKIACM